MPLINSGINFILTWSENCVIYKVDKAINFAITDTKLYVPAITSSIQNTTTKIEIKIQMHNKR